jgi:SSS family transporter
MTEGAEYIYRFGMADYYVIAFYLIMLVSIGFLVKKLCGGVSDFFVGGRRMPWWLAGAGCFMSSFSAWTFTGAAGFAYQHGILIVLIFYFNVVSFLFAGKFIAAKCRQTRRVTAAQIIFDRFGRLGEQFVVWFSVPSMIFGGAIWMMGLGTFLSVAFGVPVKITIVASGLIILLYSTLSGSWAVQTSAFVQSVILLVLSLVVFVLTLDKADGFSGFAASVNPEYFKLPGKDHSWFWVAAYFSQIFMMFNSIGGAAPRYLSVKDGGEAKKVAYFAAFLFLLGPVIWFVPPIAASHFFPDLTGMLPGLKHPQDGAYVVMALDVLPSGLAGLLVMVIFAATLSSMDAAINQNAGSITLNIYKPLFRPKAKERELFVASRLFNVFCGLAVMGGALLMARQEEFALFDLMLILSSVISLPLAVPFVLMYWVKKTPQWSAVASVFAGGVFSYFSFRADWSLAARVFGIIGMGSVAFLLTGFLWKKVSVRQRKKIEQFYDDMRRPVDVSHEVEGAASVSQLRPVGGILLGAGVALFGVLLFPNDMRSRLVIGAAAFLIFMVGLIMFRAGGRSLRRQQVAPCEVECELQG